MNPVQLPARHRDSSIEKMNMNKQQAAVLMRAACMVLTAVLFFIGLGLNSPSAQSDRAISHKGGEVTIINGPQQNTFEVRTSRFRCLSCVARVLETLKREPGISDVAIDESAKPVILRVRIEPTRVTVTRIGTVVKKALESDPYNTAPVTVKYATEK